MKRVDRVMVERLGAILPRYGLEPLDWRADVWEASRAAEGGSITERHILYAVARNVVRAVGKGQPLVAFLRGSLGLVPCAADGDLARRCRRTRHCSTISWGS